MNRAPAVIAILFAVFIASPTVARAAGWDISCVECRKTFEPMTDRSLQLDGQGHLHAAYGGDHLYYAWHDGSQWHVEVADASDGVGEFAALGVDPEGQPHIGYWDATRRAVKYAYRTGSQWHVETIDVELGEEGGHISLAVDAAGRPHVSYRDEVTWSQTILRYAYRDAGAWHLETVDPYGIVGEYSSLALDPNGQPRISYFVSYPHDDLRYAWREADGWYTETVESEDVVGLHTSLALDAAGRACIGYLAGTDWWKYVKIACQEDDGWDLQVVDDADSTEEKALSLRFDAAGRPRIAIASQSTSASYEIRYAYPDGQQWYVETALTGWNDVWAISLVLDPAGTPHVFYGCGITTVSGAVRHARREAGGWVWEPVDVEGDAGQNNSLALDAQGNPHISYRAADPFFNSDQGLDTNLHYAYLDAGGWHVETVDGEGVFSHLGAWQTSLALDPSGYTHIAYYDDTHGHLKYAYQDPAGWHVEVVTAEGVGSHNSLALALDSLGRPHIAHTETWAIRHAFKAGTDWEIETITEDGGYSCLSLAIDAVDRPHLIFHASWDDDSLRYATQEGSTWLVETIDSDLGSSSSCREDLALEPGGVPHMVYASWPADEIRHAVRRSGTWHQDLVAAGAGDFASLAVDDLGHGHATWMDWQPGSNLQYACQGDEEWRVETVDAGIGHGYGTSLALTSGSPRIVYHDVTERELNYARPMPPGAQRLYLPLVVRLQ